MAAGEGTHGRSVSVADLGIEGLGDLGLIGEGGSARVYRSTEIASGRPVAVKVLHGLTDDESRRRFERERWLMTRLGDHPNLVMPHRFGFTTGGSPFLVMDYLAGRSLQDRLDADGPIAWNDAAGIVLAVADAVAHAHAHEIIHRDIKPANILLTADGVPKLSDFGIAAVRDAPSERVVFSMAHCPPEAFRSGTDERDQRSDLYSLASTVYALVTGRAPFAVDGPDTAPAYLRRIELDPIPSVGRRRPDAFLARALAKDPAQRPPTVAEFRSALEETLDDGVPFAPAAAPKGDTASVAIVSAATVGDLAPGLTAAAPGAATTELTDAGTRPFDPPMAAATISADRPPRRRLAMPTMSPEHRARLSGLMLTPGRMRAVSGVVLAVGLAGLVAVASDRLELFGLGGESPGDGAGSGPVAVVQDDAGATDQDAGSSSSAPSITVDGAEEAHQQGVAAFNQGDIAASIGHFDRAATLDPAHPEVFIYRSLAHRVQQRFDQAVSDGDRAVANSPANGDAYLNRGIALAANGEPTKALADLDQAVALKPDAPTVYLNRGKVHESLGAYGAAIDDYDEVVSRLPTTANPYWFRAEAHGRAGNVIEARADLDAFLSLAEPSDGRIVEAEDLVAELELGNNPFLGR